MRSVAWVAWVAWVALIVPARGRASEEITNIMHIGDARSYMEAKVAVGKNKASKATPAVDNCIGRLQRKILVERGARFRCAIRCLHRKGAPDGKPSPNAETWASGSLPYTAEVGLTSDGFVPPQAIEPNRDMSPPDQPAELASNSDRRMEWPCLRPNPASTRTGHTA